MALNIKELGIYIHIPFCVSKCIYCDFLSMPADDEIKEQYVYALCDEIKAFADNHREEYEVDTIFVGGGTPSILKPYLMERIFTCINDNFTVKEECEITIECNPGTLDLIKLNTYKNLSVNRLSIGLQSVNDEELKALGRIHTYKDFLKSYELALKAGFGNINVDLMSALPGQTVASWTKTLKSVTMLKPSHISAYSLIVEENTPLYDMVENNVITNLPDEDAERMIYAVTGEVLGDLGYNRYEISNYSKPGWECRHNICYWKRGDYAGFGISAASLIGRKRYANTRDLKSYIDNPIQDKEDVDILSIQDEMSEFMFLGLRMMEGVSFSDFKNCFGRQLMNVYGEVVDKYIRSGHLENSQTHIRLTQKGIDVSNVIFADFV